MANHPSSTDTTPRSFPETTPSRSFDMPAHTVQMIFEINGAIGRIEQSIKDLDKRIESNRSDLRQDHQSVEGRLRSIEKHWHWVAGGIGVAIVLIPICGAIVWYSLGERINQALQINTGSISRTLDE